MASETNSQTDSLAGRIWYALVSVILFCLLLLPWLNGVVPAAEPLRFFQVLPFPVGNILVASYLVVIGLNFWSMLTLDHSLRMLWYRFTLTMVTMVAILTLSAMGAAFSQAVAIVWLLLFFVACAELVFLYSR